MAELRIEGLAKRLGMNAVLHDLDLTVPAGGLTAILGASGSGKTTLLRTICGFERPDAGRIEIGSSIVADRATHQPPERRRIGYVAQDGALFPHLSVAQNIVFGLPRALRKGGHKVAELLDLVGLHITYADRPPQSLSGGEQQRVALARALAPGPALVLLDEPFSSLDTALRVETREAVAKALAAAGATAVLVTHDQAEALSLGRQVAVLRGGRFVQVAEPRDLYRRPVDRATAQFVGEAVIVPGEVRGGRAICHLGDLTLIEPAPEGRADLMIRPEQIRLLGVGDSQSLMARVVTVVFSGHEARVELLSIDADPPIALTARTFGHLSPEPGSLVRLEVDGPVKAFARAAADQTGTTLSETPVQILERAVVYT